MRSERTKSKSILFSIISLVILISISSITFYAVKVHHHLTELTEQTSQLEYAASYNTEQYNERINELESEIESISFQLDEQDTPATETKSSDESSKKDTTAYKPVKEESKPAATTQPVSQPKQSAQYEYDGIHISHDKVFNGTTASFFLYDNKPSDAGYYYKGTDVQGGLFIPHSEAAKYKLAEMGDSVIDVTFDQEGNIVSVKKNDEY